MLGLNARGLEVKATPPGGCAVRQGLHKPKGMSSGSCTPSRLFDENKKKKQKKQEKTSKENGLPYLMMATQLGHFLKKYSKNKHDMLYKNCSQYVD